MRKFWIPAALIGGVLTFGGCAKRALVSYSQVETLNEVEVTLITGQTLEGEVKSAEPHQLVLLTADREERAIPQSTVRSIRRRPPVYDDSGKCIGENEIRSEMNHKNAWVYGLGGGALSFGTSFFIGSMATKKMENSGGTLTGITVGGGALGTFFFVKAGKAKDRAEAIERIRDRRRQIQLKPETRNKNTEKIQQSLDEEKKKQEELRKEREQLLQQLHNRK
jgi:hypothetical protein